MIDNTVEKLNIPGFSQFSIELLLVITEGISVVIQKAHFMRNQAFPFFTPPLPPKLSDLTCIHDFLSQCISHVRETAYGVL